MDTKTEPASSKPTRDPEGAPRSVLRLLGLFEALTQAEDGMALAELSTALGIPKSSLLMLIRPLTANGYLTHRQGRYQLGPRIFQLASEIVGVRRLRKIVRPIMEDLVTRTNETVLLMVFDKTDRSATFTEVIDGPQAVRYIVPPGTRLPLYCSSGGRLFLAYETKEWREDYLKSIKPKKVTPATITDKAELRRIIENVRETGVSISVGESAAEAAGISAPIFDADGKVLAALGLGAPTDRFDRECAMLEMHIVEAAAAASASMGYRAPPAVPGKARRTTLKVGS